MGPRAVPDRHPAGPVTAEEGALYAELVSDRWGDAVRLEQERVDWSWVETRLPYAASRPSR